MAIVLFVIFCLIFLIPDSSATNIECNYNKKLDYAILGYIYQCEVINNANITDTASAHISRINGTHESPKTNDAVLSVSAGEKIIKKFPRGLHKFFKNLKAIYIYSCNLKEIHQSDLRHFSGLVYFLSSHNGIEVIEKGLFKFNPKLEVVGFRESELIHIDPNVFDHLSLLSRFFFTSVPCINQEVLFSVEKVRDAINLSKSKCLSLEYLELEGKIENLEDESRSLKFEDFRITFENFELNFKDSKFLRHRPLKEKFEDLKMTAECSNCAQVTKLTALNSKVNSLAAIFDNILIITLKNQTSKLDDLKSSKCGTKDSFAAILSSNDRLESSINDVKSSQNGAQSTLTAIKSSTANQEVELKNLQSTLFLLSNSINKLNKNVDEMRESISKLDSIDDKVTALDGDIRSLKDNFLDFEVRNSEKFTKIEKELVNIRHKITIDIDEKMKVLTRRLINKFEDILKNN
ncbi:hypothetical protein ACKWTF_015186 [Chironomus riparius]